jgi:hypothetical protein
MSNEVKTQAGQAVSAAAAPERKRGAAKYPPAAGVLIILIGIAVLFENHGLGFQRVTFPVQSPQRLFIIVLQVSVVGLLAIA